MKSNVNINLLMKKENLNIPINTFGIKYNTIIVWGNETWKIKFKNFQNKYWMLWNRLSSNMFIIFFSGVIDC
jgi:hypothetical protein